ncbi:TonB-dependent receptor [Acidipila sp. 4G-K13]|uniref:TonB-dependent receptor n=1 Tax=Paracidobacterium acidisoli TaxID=2303751 RepID=A0A372IR84_9BACT|nr:TonB-dependent receptor [Paracidobacterium acidisoli]
MAGLFLFFCFTGTAYAQYDNGSCVGTIHDTTGAAISGATVTATDTATGIATKTTSNGTGDYVFPSLRIGTYNISATMQGFAVAVAQNISITVGGRQRIDLSLNPGEAQTTVEVSDVALQIETDSSQRDQTITQYQSQAFPLVTRNYTDLLGLVTGSRATGNGVLNTSVSSLIRYGSFNINGQRSMFNNFLLDGIDNNAYGESNQGFDNQIIAVPPDSVAQFSVVTNNESAEYGRSSAATINVSSASGTNQFHAMAYEFLRNTDLNAIGYFPPLAPGTTSDILKPKFNRNQFGINFGGPILKDKLFFFLDYEGFRQVLSPVTFLSLPNANERNGILSVAVQDPYTGQLYPAGTSILGSSDISPTSAKVLNYLNTLVPANPALSPSGSIVNDYQTQAPFTDNSDKGDLRLDYQLDPKDAFFLRVSDRKETAVNQPTLPLPLDGGTNGTQRILDQQIALGYTRQISSNKLLDARLGLSRTKAGKYTLSIGDNVFSIPGLPTDPTVAGGLPSTSISGGFSALGRQSTNPQWQNPALLDPKVNYSWVIGKHSLKFGYEYEHIWMAVQDANPLYGSFTYSGGFSKTGTSTAADNYWADFLFGSTSQYAIATYFVAHLRQEMDNAYAQDDWKISPTLTLNLGLRWEYGSPYWEQHNLQSNFDPSTATLIQAKSGGIYDRSLVHPDLNDFAPRVGFAWAASPHTSVRGGFGSSYVHYTRAGSGDILAINAPQALFYSVNQTPGSAGYKRVDQGFSGTLSQPFTAATQLTDNITYVPANTRDSYVQSYYLSVQQALAKNTLLDIAYVGNRGLKLQDFLNFNQKNPSNGFARPIPSWGDITEALNEGYSTYNALQVRYEQRYSHGLTLLNSFTWGHSLDNDSASLESNTPSPQDANNLRAEYAQSDYNQPIVNTTSLVYELPFGKGRSYMNQGGFLNAALGGWQVSAINQMQAGIPFNLVYNPPSYAQVSPLISATYRGANEYRPNRVPGQKLILSKSKAAGANTVQYVNVKGALELPATGTQAAPLSPFGSLGRNPMRTPSYYDTDFAFNKKFDTPLDNLKVEFRAEMYNAFNHTNFNLPSTTISGTQSTTAAAPASSGGVVSSTFEPRIFQFGLKILY